MGKDVIIALDFDSREKTLAFLDRFQDEKPFVKIGMELFYAEGPDIVRQIRARGHRIFLDLKLHDIPNTVKKAMAALSALDVDIINLHAAGTKAMMRAALEGQVFAMQLRDETRACRDLWARAGEGTLRGQFLAQLKQKYDAAGSDRDRETIVMAARWGLAALDHDEEVVTL